MAVNLILSGPASDQAVPVSASGVAANVLSVTYGGPPGTLLVLLSIAAECVGSVNIRTEWRLLQNGVAVPAGSVVFSTGAQGPPSFGRGYLFAFLSLATGDVLQLVGSSLGANTFVRTNRVQVFSLT